MFNVNDFKQKVKQWIEDNPLAQEAELLDYCEELIPPSQFAANKWLVEQTISWYKHILLTRDKFSPTSEYKLPSR